MAKLSEVWDCKTLEDAKKKLEQLRKSKLRAQQAFEKELEEFQKKWGEKLDVTD
jgi:hypothetical protein